MIGIKNRKIVSNTILYSIGEIVPRVVSFLILPILTRYLTPDDYGILSYTTTAMAFVFAIAALSLNTYLLKNYYAEPDEESRKRLIGTLFLFIVVFNVVLLLIEIWLSPKLLQRFDVAIPFYPFFLLAVINNFFDVLSIIPLVVYRAKENAKGFVILSVSRIVLQMLLTYVLVVFFNQGLLGSYLARLYINIPFAVIYFYIIFIHGKYSFDIPKIKKALRFSIPFIPANISFLAVAFSDRIIMERFISLKDIGIYSVAFTLTLALNIVVQALYRTFEQIIFKNIEKPDFPKLNLKLATIYSTLVILAGFGLSLLSPEVFFIAASKDFFAGYRLVPFMVISVVFAAYNTYLNTLLIGKGKERLVSLFTLVSACTSVVLNFALLPHFGYYGSIIASVSAMLVAYIGGYVANGIISYRIIVIQVVGVLLVAAVAYLLNNIYNIHLTLYALFIKAGIFLIFTLLFIKYANLHVNWVSLLKRIKNKGNNEVISKT